MAWYIDVGDNCCYADHEVKAWRWCTYVHDATAFNSLKEAKQYIAKYIEEFGNTKYHFAFMEPAVVMKDYYSHEILEEV